MQKYILAQRAENTEIVEDIRAKNIDLPFYDGHNEERWRSV